MDVTAGRKTGGCNSGARLVDSNRAKDWWIMTEQRLVDSDRAKTGGQSQSERLVDSDRAKTGR